MEGYRKNRLPVKGKIEVPDTGSLVKLASKELLVLSLEIGIEVIR
jgi:hypothetical protein